MIFFLGKELNDRKPVFIALSQIVGIGEKYGLYLTKKAGIGFKTVLQKCNREFLRRISRCVSLESLIAIELHRTVINEIKLQIQKKTYKGLRHSMGLPVRGQRTKTNRKTAKKLNYHI